MDQCSGCKREIVWVKTIAGKSMPADPELIRIITQKKGAVTIVTDDGLIVRGRKVFDIFEPGGIYGLPVHRARCKERERFKV